MKKKTKFKLFCYFSAVIFLAASLYVSSNRIMSEIAEASFGSLISSASYYAIDKLMDKEYSYEDLMTIEKDPSGDVQMIVTDSYKVNEFSRRMATVTYEYLAKNLRDGIDVPIGAFTGIRLISGFGYGIKMKLISVGSVKCEMVSEFSEAGINQTRHTLYLNIYCTVDIITKGLKKQISDGISVMVYDNLIIGKVPHAYVNSSVIGKGEQ